MVQFADQVEFVVRPIASGRGWQIVATHPSGQQEGIAGFQDEAEAKQWLNDSAGLRAWLKTRGYVRSTDRASARDRLTD